MYIPNVSGEMVFEYALDASFSDILDTIQVEVNEPLLPIKLVLENLSAETLLLLSLNVNQPIAYLLNKTCYASMGALPPNLQLVDI